MAVLRGGQICNPRMGGLVQQPLPGRRCAQANQASLAPSSFGGAAVDAALVTPYSRVVMLLVHPPLLPQFGGEVNHGVAASIGTMVAPPRCGGASASELGSELDAIGPRRFGNIGHDDRLWRRATRRRWLWRGRCRCRAGDDDGLVLENIAHGLSPGRAGTVRSCGCRGIRMLRADHRSGCAGQAESRQILQDTVFFGLLGQAIFGDIADADQADDDVILDHRHVPGAALRHHFHRFGDTLGG